MSDKKEEKKEEKKEDKQTYTGTKKVADRAFAEWICKQWRRGEHLESIDVIEYFPRGAMKGFGRIVDTEDFDKGHIVDMEEAVDLSNRFVGSAQLNCDRIHKDKREMTYYARAFDKGRAASDTPVDTFPLFLNPKTRYADEDTDEDATPQSITLDYIRETISALKFDRQRDDANIGDVVATLIQQVREERAWSKELHEILRKTTGDWVQAIREREAAFSQEQDRLPQREMAKVKAEMIRDTFRAGKNLLTGAIGNLMEKRPPQNGNSPTNGQQIERVEQRDDVAKPDAPMTQERMHLDNFFSDCKNAKIDNALFGEWAKNEDGSAKLVKPGVFTPDQVAILVKVWKGYATADTLDDLIPANVFPENAGKPISITMKQLGEAQAIEGMSEGIAASLIQIVALRKRRRTETATPPPTATAEPAANKENADA